MPVSRSLTLTPLCAAAALALASMAAQAATPATTTRVIVGFDTATEAAAARPALAKLGAQLKVDLPHIAAVAVELPASALARLQQLSGVSYVEEDVKRYAPTLMPSSPPPTEGSSFSSFGDGDAVPYGIDQVQARKVPLIGTPRITVCIIDSGLDRSHPDLAPNRITGDSDLAGNWWEDGSHHGTHVAGTIAAASDGHGVVGVAARGEVDLHSVRVFNDNGKWQYSSTLSAATQKCKQAGAKVINMSLGGPLPSKSERKNFDQLERDGIISVAASGNDGMPIKGYPASYSSVISVAAVDFERKVASFSTYNSQVDFAAPGVNVASTVPVGTGLGSMLRQDGIGPYNTAPMTGSSQTAVSAPMYDLGLASKRDAKAFGKICLIKRGDTTFAEKTQVCMDSGGVGAIIYNNESGSFGGTLGTMNASIPVVSASDTVGARLLDNMRVDASLRVSVTDWAYYDGTSMATPHVSGVVAKLWRLAPQCNNLQIRRTLELSAMDVGKPGRDDHTGYGLVRLRAAYDRIMMNGCGN